MSDDDYNPYLPDGPGSRMDIKDGPGLVDFLPDVSGGYKATAGAPLAGAAGPADGDIVEAALKTGHDPEIPVNIFELGLIYKIDVDKNNKVLIEMTLTSPNCPVAESLPNSVKENILKIDGIKDVDLKLVWDPPWTPDKMSDAAKLELNLA